MPRTDSLLAEDISSNLCTARVGRKILVYESTSSTNDIAAEYAKNKDSDGLVVFAEHQSAGRTRKGPTWHSEPGQSILCSVILRQCAIGAELLSLTCAVAAAECVNDSVRGQAGIKWPNDIMINGRKVAGILLERKLIDEQVCYIAGIGINCHQQRRSFPAELRQFATSIDIESGTICDRALVAKRLLTSLDHWFETALKDSDKIIQQWRRASLLLGQRLTVAYNTRRFSGNCIGVDPEKGLIVQLDTGGVRMFDAAQSTVVESVLTAH